MKNIIKAVSVIVLIAIIGGLCFGYFKKYTSEVKNPIVTMEIQDLGTIKLELYPDKFVYCYRIDYGEFTPPHNDNDDNENDDNKIR